MIPIGKRIQDLLYCRGISTLRFEEDTGIARRILYPSKHKTKRTTLMAIAYYLDMTVEELVSGTDAEKDWYGDFEI